MRSNHKIISCVFVLFAALLSNSWAQSVSFELKTSPDVNFTFNTVNQYLAGVTQPNAVRLNVVADIQWALYVGTTTDDVGLWDEIASYSLVGQKPPVSILQMRARNSGATSQVTGFFNLADISTPTYLIGSNAPGPLINCDDIGTNAPGSYISDPNCYQFDVDLRITPGFDYSPGLYKLRVDYIIVGYL